MSEHNHDELQEVEVITLLDEESQPHSFYIIDVFESEGNRYAALQSIAEEDEELDEEEPAEDESMFEEGETILLRLEKSDEGDILVGIDDDEEFDKVVSIFESRLEGEED